MTDVLARMTDDGFEQVLFCHDRSSGLRCVVAIHDTTLGPALGAVRMWPYDSTDDAVADAMRFAATMTLKAAAAGLSLGGGAAVVIGDSGTDKTEALLLAVGRSIATLGGRFIPVNDVGTVQRDIEVIGRAAAPVCDSGDPSPFTALGVVEAMRASLRAVTGDGELRGKRVCVQGVGNVGGRLADLLHEEGAELIVADRDDARARAVADRVGAEVVDADGAIDVECDVFSPCALGGVITDETVDRLACRIVAGGANNVLDGPGLAQRLAERDVVYVPDFCANAGGLIFLEEQLLGHDLERARERVRGVGDRVAQVLETARREDVTTTDAATRFARERLDALARVGPPFLP